MGEGLKQRLLGAVVLLGILVALAPAVFQGGNNHPLVLDAASVGKGQQSANLQDSLLVVPAGVKALAEPAEVVTIDQLATQEPVVHDSARPIVQPEVKKDPQAGTERRGFMKSWVLQVGTFSNIANAKALVRRLQEAGYTAYHKDAKLNTGKVVFRVFVGPEVKQTLLEPIKTKLKKEMSLDSFVVKYEP